MQIRVYNLWLYPNFTIICQVCKTTKTHIDYISTDNIAIALDLSFVPAFWLLTDHFGFVLFWDLSVAGQKSFVLQLFDRRKRKIFINKHCQRFHGSNCLNGYLQMIYFLCLLVFWRVKCERMLQLRTFFLKKLLTLFKENFRWGRQFSIVNVKQLITQKKNRKNILSFLKNLQNYWRKLFDKKSNFHFENINQLMKSSKWWKT